MKLRIIAGAAVVAALLAVAVMRSNRPPWATFILHCERPAGVLVQTDPPQWFAAHERPGADVIAQVDAAIVAGRVVAINVSCPKKLST